MVFFVCFMQLLSYMLWMKKCSMTFSLESESGLYVIKAYLFHITICTCSGGIHHIKIEKFCITMWVHFFSMPLYNSFLYKLFIYMGLNFIVTHAYHLGFQWRVYPLPPLQLIFVDIFNMRMCLLTSDYALWILQIGSNYCQK